MAAQGQRDLQRIADEFPDLFPRRPFDGGVFSTLAMANAFSAPNLDAVALRVVNRASLWAFRLDWLVDYLSTSLSEVEDFAGRCLAVVDGAPPGGDDLLVLLARLRDDLADRPGFAAGRPAWREELRRMLDAMATEWTWRKGGVRPSVPSYLDNADNLGSSFVNVSHWLGTGPVIGAQLSDVLTATRAQQRVIRVVNDLGTYERDVEWGDLNVMLLGPTKAEATDLVRTLTAECADLLVPLRGSEPALADFLGRQLEFCRGFYGVTDYWGEL